MRKRYTPDDMSEVLRLHKLWLEDAEGGSRADLTGANLYGANLYGADLTRADLTRANLYGANLTGANLYGADLTGADLTRANLTGANLTGANLYGADLTGADLTRANLTGADLYGADLTGSRGGPSMLCVGPIGSRKAYTTYFIDDDRVQCGCWNDYKGGTLEEFSTRVHQEHATNPVHLAEYLAAISLFASVRDARAEKAAVA